MRIARFGQSGIGPAVVGLMALAVSVWGAGLNDSYNSLKEAFDKKDVAQVKTLAGQTSKEAKEVAAEAQPSDAAAVDAWKGRQEFAKQAQEYAEYTLAASAAADAASAVDLTETLVALNPKSRQVDVAAPYYLAALNKQGAAKANAGAQKIIAGNPEQVDALYQLAAGNPQYANKLVAVMRAKPKPEGVSDADWDRKKTQMIQSGTYFGAVAPCSRSSWAECDRAMAAAQPVLQGTSMIGTVLFYRGVANFQLGTLTADKSKEKIGLEFTKQAAATPGPMQGAAANNVPSMTKTLATPGR